jgi:hypothetical protein
MVKRSGWFGESRRHALASKGVESGRKQRTRLPRKIRKLKLGQHVVSAQEYERQREKESQDPERELMRIKQSVREAVREAVDYYMKDHGDYSADDVLSTINDDGTMDEIADSHVPVYTSDIMDLASVGEIYGHENDLPPAFGGEPTPQNIIATSIYEVLEQVGFDELRDYVNKLDEQGKFEMILLQ